MGEGRLPSLNEALTSDQGPGAPLSSNRVFTWWNNHRGQGQNQELTRTQPSYNTEFYSPFTLYQPQVIPLERPGLRTPEIVTTYPISRYSGNYSGKQAVGSNSQNESTKSKVDTISIERPVERNNNKRSGNQAKQILQTRNPPNPSTESVVEPVSGAYDYYGTANVDRQSLSSVLRMTGSMKSIYTPNSNRYRYNTLPLGNFEAGHEPITITPIRPVQKQQGEFGIIQRIIRPVSPQSEFSQGRLHRIRQKIAKPSIVVKNKINELKSKNIAETESDTRTKPNFVDRPVPKPQDNEPKSERESDTDPIPEPDPEPNPNASSKLDPEPQPDPKPNMETISKPDTESESDPKIDPEPNPKQDEKAKLESNKNLNGLDNEGAQKPADPKPTKLKPLPRRDRVSKPVKVPSGEPAPVPTHRNLKPLPKVQPTKSNELKDIQIEEPNKGKDNKQSQASDEAEKKDEKKENTEKQEVKKKPIENHGGSKGKETTAEDFLSEKQPDRKMKDTKDMNGEKKDFGQKKSTPIENDSEQNATPEKKIDSEQNASTKRKGDPKKQKKDSKTKNDSKQRKSKDKKDSKKNKKNIEDDPKQNVDKESKEEMPKGTDKDSANDKEERSSKKNSIFRSKTKGPKVSENDSKQKVPEDGSKGERDSRKKSDLKKKDDTKQKNPEESSKNEKKSKKKKKNVKDDPKQNSDKESKGEMSKGAKNESSKDKEEKSSKKKSISEAKNKGPEVSGNNLDLKIPEDDSKGGKDSKKKSDLNKIDDAKQKDDKGSKGESSDETENESSKDKGEGSSERKSIPEGIIKKYSNNDNGIKNKTREKVVDVLPAAGRAELDNMQDILNQRLQHTRKALDAYSNVEHEKQRREHLKDETEVENMPKTDLHLNVPDMLRCIKKFEKQKETVRLKKKKEDGFEKLTVVKYNPKKIPANQSVEPEKFEPTKETVQVENDDMANPEDGYSEKNVSDVLKEEEQEDDD
ncbi:hypothetical protein Ciccas_008443 [Cichlidogyrus casuarinus]|uniref:Uncharacterized protein n=1 Tax=Cichlidogyrus casuarinus TaxID=1844966 RepID=A0ABD2Q1E9_9PLAT